MSIGKAIAALFESSNPAADNDVKHGKFTDVSLWVLAALVGGMIWLAHGVVTDANLQRLFWASLVYMTLDTAKVITAMIVNGMTRRRSSATRVALAKEFMRDEKLDGNEANALSATTSALVPRTESTRASST
jgi:hypothetical protein